MMGNFWNPQQQQQQQQQQPAPLGNAAGGVQGMPMQGPAMQGQPPMSNQQILARMLMAHRGAPGFGMPMQPMQGGLQQPQGVPGALPGAPNGPAAPPMAPQGFRLPAAAPAALAPAGASIAAGYGEDSDKPAAKPAGPTLFGLGGAGAAAGAGVRY